MLVRANNIDLTDCLASVCRGPSRVLVFAGNRTAKGDVLLCLPGELVPLERLSRLRLRRGQWVEVHPMPNGLPFPSETSIRRELDQAGPLHDDDVLAVLVGGLNPTRIFGLAQRGAGPPVPIEAVVVLGPGLEVYPFPGASSSSALPPSDRYVGALGGQATYDSLQALRVAVVGAGGLGSRVLELLARAGVSATVIDPDEVADHNLHRMALATLQDVGRNKAATIVNNAAWTGTLTRAIQNSVISPAGVEALDSCEVIISATDQRSARLFCGLLASSAGSVLIDIGTGVREVDGHRRVGMDVRLLLPGICFLHAGGVRDLPAAVAQLHQELAGVPMDPTSDWRERGRLGSLASLNSCCAGIAVGLLEDLVAQRLRQSLWLRWEVGENGVPAIRQIPLTPSRTCPLCNPGSIPV